MEHLCEEILRQMDAHLEWIERCLGRLSDEDVWKRIRPQTNSIGNLCLHLAGNESHYLGRGVGETSYERDRPAEFNAVGGTGCGDLLEKLRKARSTTRSVFGRLTAADFPRPVDIDHPPQATVLRLMLHVAEHYAYHTGQIVLLTRYFQDGEERVLDWGH